MSIENIETVTNAITDWWMFGATIFAGVLTAIVTFIAVWYTNKKTVELYEKDKEYQNRRNNMVIIKPTIKMGSFFGIIEELILFNIRDRVLLVSSDKDGFDFFDDNDSTDGYRYLYSTFEYSGNGGVKSNLKLKVEIPSTEVSVEVKFDYAYISMIIPSVFL